MNPGTTQDENAGKAMRKRTVLAVLGALLFALSTAWAAGVDAGSPQG
jgi:hypothetical protein